MAHHTLDSIARHLKGRLIGDGATPISGINSIEEVRPGELTFAADPQHLAEALATQAAAVIAPADGDLGTKPGIIVQNPKLAFALVLELFNPDVVEAPGVHPTAVLGRNVRLGTGVSIRAHAAVGDDAVIGDGTVIESSVHVGAGTTIGDQCYIAPNVVIYRQTRIGHRVRIHGGSIIGGDGFGYVFHQGRHVKVPQVGNVIIEDDVEIGCNSCVDRATVGSTIIGRGTKIDNLVQIAHNNRIGQHVVIAGECGFSGSITVGDYAVFGGRVAVTDHVTIGDRVQVGFGSVVTKSIPAGQIVFGYPARPARKAKAQIAALGLLPSLFKRVAQLEGKRSPTASR